VNGKNFSSQPSLSDLLRLLSQNGRKKFVYHSSFSTSSFFLPSLYLRSNQIFHMGESTESLVAIESAKIDENSSTRLVKMVADGQADLAAVWDGTKSKFEPNNEYGKKVYFVQLPTPIPNDLLVCSATLDAGIRQRLRQAVRSMPANAIGIGDFLGWSSIREATDARTALANLRWLARESPARVVVDIRSHDKTKGTRESSMLLDAGRQALRLSGTEFVLFDEDFHEQIDFIWTLEPIHDGAVVLHSATPGSNLPDQRFEISFRDTEDLTRRLVSIINSGIHRIRYIWPYSGNNATVIRDLAFSLPPKSVVKLQRISWLDPERNNFRAGPFFDGEITESDFFKFSIESSELSVSGAEGAAFDPMSNVSYRVFLLRSNEENLLFRLLTVALIVLLAGAAVGMIFEIRKRS
jgi:hypothetical protein